MHRTALPCTVLLGLWLATSAFADAIPQGPSSGTVEISQAHVGAVAGQTVGGGTLRFQGHSYPFNLAGLGAGTPRIRAFGEVYGLLDLADFSGTYRETARTEPSTDEPGGGVTLINERGVIIRLRSHWPHAMLTLGPRGVRIRVRAE